MLKQFTDPELGLITIKPHSTARRMIFRAVAGGILITVPASITDTEIKDTFEKNRHKLPRLQASLSDRPRICNGARLEMFDFCVQFSESSMGNMFESRFSNNVLEFVSPRNTDYTRPEVLDFYKKNISKVLKHKADRYLPKRLDLLARHIKASYSKCSVSHGKQRLGCCNSNAEISLSYRLMMLPGDLIDYIILHELAHLREMNHGEGFHSLLDKYCSGRHRELEQKLKRFKFPI